MKNPKDPRRQSIFDLPGRWMNTMHLARNTHLVAEALAHYLFNLSGSELLFPQGKESIKKHLEAWIGFLGSEPRSSQLLLGQSNPVVEALATSMKRYLGEVKVIYAKSDKRDPEFLLYDTTHTTMHAYVVKPAIFDLFLSAMIAAYFAAVVLVIKVAFSRLLQSAAAFPVSTQAEGKLKAVQKAVQLGVQPRE
ncbi:unnamed protein product [Darwinula stevensoni]|uniref:Uncharacterized protein n=1 Tax=Darwinula stevensoni TaxID=69355 RepID=A0A7R9A9X6_9CRUS|nr:unnamed protein product [Darwinula stevensoni]CAG0897862.1 unnamed protein product [Darwinula stevensoni]